MGYKKDRLMAAEEKAEDDWRKVAWAKGYVCAADGDVIPKSELNTSSQPLFCAYHRHQLMRD